MTNGNRSETAGLIFLGLRDLDIVKIGNRVSAAFETLEEKVTSLRILSDDSARISSLNHDVTVTLREDQVVDGMSERAPLMMELSIEPTQVDAADAPAQDTVLAHALRALHRTFSADRVKWVTPGAVLSSADFIMATSPDEADAADATEVTISRHKTGVIEKRYSALPNIDEMTELLDRRMSQKHVLQEDIQLRGAFGAPLPEAEDEEEEDIREETAPLRLSVWMVSFSVALFALPVGAALVVFNLLKGENLRLSAQVAALTGTFIALNTYGTTAQAMTILQAILN